MSIEIRLSYWIILDNGRDTAYNLFKRKDFPSMKLCREYMVMTDMRNDWQIKQQRNMNVR